MAIMAKGTAPYAPQSGVMEIITRYRSKGLQTPFTGDVLVRAGVSETLVPRTLQALRLLDLIRDDGMPTENLEALRRAPESDYKAALAAWVKAVYADVFAFVDPTEDETRVRDAFRDYVPFGQQDRMVALFLALCRVAGLREDEAAEGRARKVRRPTIRSVSASTFTPASRNAKVHQQKDQPVQHQHGVPAAISGLLQSLAGHGTAWTKTERDAFMKTFEVVLDFCYPVATKPKDATKAANSEDLTMRKD